MLSILSLCVYYAHYFKHTIFIQAIDIYLFNLVVYPKNVFA